MNIIHDFKTLHATYFSLPTSEPMKWMAAISAIGCKILFPLGHDMIAHTVDFLALQAGYELYRNRGRFKKIGIGIEKKGLLYRIVTPDSSRQILCRLEEIACELNAVYHKIINSNRQNWEKIGYEINEKVDWTEGVAFEPDDETFKLISQDFKLIGITIESLEDYQFRIVTSSGSTECSIIELYDQLDEAYSGVIDSHREKLNKIGWEINKKVHWTEGLEFLFDDTLKNISRSFKLLGITIQSPRDCVFRIETSSGSTECSIIELYDQLDKAYSGVIDSHREKLNKIGYKIDPSVHWTVGFHFYPEGNTFERISEKFKLLGITIQSPRDCVFRIETSSGSTECSIIELYDQLDKAYRENIESWERNGLALLSGDWSEKIIFQCGDYRIGIDDDPEDGLPLRLRARDSHTFLLTRKNDRKSIVLSRSANLTLEVKRLMRELELWHLVQRIHSSQDTPLRSIKLNGTSSIAWLDFEFHYYTVGTVEKMYCNLPNNLRDNPPANDETAIKNWYRSLGKNDQLYRESAELQNERNGIIHKLGYRTIRSSISGILFAKIENTEQINGEPLFLTPGWKFDTRAFYKHFSDFHTFQAGFSDPEIIVTSKYSETYSENFRFRLVYDEEQIVIKRKLDGLGHFSYALYTEAFSSDEVRKAKEALKRIERLFCEMEFRPDFLKDIEYAKPVPIGEQPSEDFLKRFFHDLFNKATTDEQTRHVSNFIQETNRDPELKKQTLYVLQAHQNADDGSYEALTNSVLNYCTTGPVLEIKESYRARFMPNKLSHLPEEILREAAGRGMQKTIYFLISTSSEKRETKHVSNFVIACLKKKGYQVPPTVFEHKGDQFSFFGIRGFLDSENRKAYQTLHTRHLHDRLKPTEFYVTMAENKVIELFTKQFPFFFIEALEEIFNQGLETDSRNFSETVYSLLDAFSREYLDGTPESLAGLQMPPATEKIDGSYLPLQSIMAIATQLRCDGQKVLRNN